MSEDFADAFGVVKPSAAAAAAATTAPSSTLTSMRLEDFWAYAPTHQYLYVPCNTLYVLAFMNSHFPPQPVLDRNGVPKMRGGKAITMSAGKWLDKHRWINQLTWAPGEPEFIEGRVTDKGGWKQDPNARILNQYQPAQIKLGDPAKAGRWIDHMREIYPNDTNHITLWLAHRVQRPGEKINHALVLGGAPGIGKDTLLAGVKHAVGHWNWHDVTPIQLIGRTTEFHKSIVLHVSEARDLGENGRIDRYGFYDHCKNILATPPDTLRVNEKYVREYYIVNVIGLVTTTNYRDAIYFPPDDRRHYVAFAESKASDFGKDYWLEFWHWYEHEDGLAHVAAYLHSVDLNGFDPKAPPPKTPAFWAMADSGTTSNEIELQDAIDALGNPPALTIAMLASAPGIGDFEWLLEKSARRALPHWLERCNYLAFRNPNSKEGRWRINNRKQIVYVHTELSTDAKQAAAQALIGDAAATTIKRTQS